MLTAIVLAGIVQGIVITLRAVNVNFLSSVANKHIRIGLSGTHSDLLSDF